MLFHHFRWCIARTTGGFDEVVTSLTCWSTLQLSCALKLTKSIKSLSLKGLDGEVTARETMRLDFVVEIA
jgi:hypothetical protein